MFANSRLVFQDWGGYFIVAANTATINVMTRITNDSNSKSLIVITPFFYNQRATALCYKG